MYQQQNAYQDYSMYYNQYQHQSQQSQQQYNSNLMYQQQYMNGNLYNNNGHGSGSGNGHGNGYGYYYYGGNSSWYSDRTILSIFIPCCFWYFMHIMYAMLYYIIYAGMNVLNKIKSKQQPQSKPKPD